MGKPVLSIKLGYPWRLGTQMHRTEAEASNIEIIRPLWRQTATRKEEASVRFRS
jgi:hypothetical protein